MQLRCTYCQAMFAIGREQKLAALEHMAEENLQFYDAHCPKCRRANRVERRKLELTFPGWQEAIKAMAKESTKVEKEQAEAEKPVLEPAPQVEKKPAAKPAASMKKKHVVKALAVSSLKEKGGKVTGKVTAKPTAAAKKPAAPAKKPTATAKKAGIKKK